MRLKGPIRVQINERWRDELSQRDTETALRIAGTYNASLGYS
jgi:hypothetical protein